MKTTIYLSHDHYDPDHLVEVKAEMAKLGSPTIRVIDADGGYWAVEGCHRLRAAEELGVPVNVVVLDPAEQIDHTTIDLDTCGWFDESAVPVTDYIAWYFKDYRGRPASVNVETLQ